MGHSRTVDARTLPPYIRLCSCACSWVRVVVSLRGRAADWQQLLHSPPQKNTDTDALLPAVLNVCSWVLGAVNLRRSATAWQQHSSAWLRCRGNWLRRSATSCWGRNSWRSSRASSWASSSKAGMARPAWPEGLVKGLLADFCDC